MPKYRLHTSRMKFEAKQVEVVAMLAQGERASDITAQTGVSKTAITDGIRRLRDEYGVPSFADIHQSAKYIQHAMLRQAA